MDMEVSAAPARKKHGMAFAASFLLHVLLVSALLYVLPRAGASGTGGTLALSLLSLSGTPPGQAQKAELSGEAQPEEAPAQPQAAPPKPAENEKAAPLRPKLKKKARPVAKKASAPPERNGGQAEAPASSAPSALSSGAGERSAAGEAGRDVAFGRPCGPAFSRFSRPVYPLQARRAGISGLVKLRVSLDAAGDVRGIEVLESSHRLLAEAACAAIRRSEFRPYTQDGKSLPSRTVIPIRFSLEQER